MYLNKEVKRVKKDFFCARRDALNEGVCAQTRARVRGAKATDKSSGWGKVSGPGTGEGTTVRAHPPGAGPRPGTRGPRRGEDGCARTGTLPPPFCFLGTMGESNGQARERGQRRKERDAAEGWKIQAKGRVSGIATALSLASS